MALTMYAITGDLKDQLGGESIIGDVTLTPYATTDAIVDGADVRLGSVNYDIATLPASVSLSAGPWRAIIQPRGKVNGNPQFRPLQVTFDLQADTTWGAIVSGALGPVVELTPTVDSAVAGVIGTGGQTDQALSATIAGATRALTAPSTAPGLTSTANMQARAENAETYLTTPTPDGTGQAMHPCVVFKPEGWNGHRYWMAMTPLAGGSSAVENPCILVSDDGDTWAPPSGLTNPVYPTPSNGYNSDTELLIVGDTAYLFFRSTTTDDRILLMTSTDGVTWSSAVTVLTSTVTSPSYISPTVHYDPASGVWTMWVIDKGPTPNTMERFTATSPQGPFTNKATCTGHSTQLPAGREIWHIHIHRDGDEYVMFYSDTPTGGSSSGSLWRGVSRDGLAWDMDPKRAMTGNNGTTSPYNKWDTGIYRTCAIPATVDGEKGYAIWYSGGGIGTTWRTGRTFVKLQPRKDPGSPALWLASRATAPWTHGDLMDRADSATVAGTMSSGQAWVTTTGTMGVQAKQLYGPGEVNANAIVDVGYSDVDVQVTMTKTGKPRWLVFRAGTNPHTSFWQFGDGGSINGGFSLRKYDSTDGLGVINLGTFGHFGGADGDVMRVIAKGDRIRAYVNGILVWDIRDSKHQTQTKVGVQLDSSTPRFKDFMVRPA